MSPKGNSETRNDSVHASINTDTKQSDNAVSDETSAAFNKGKSTQKTIDFSKLFADDPERNQKISIIARIILISIVYILCTEIHASIIHLEEVQKLIKTPENTPNEILETINNIRVTFSLLSLFLIILIIAFVSCFTKMIMDFLDKYPQRVFVVTVALGGILAFSIPQYLYSFKFIGETKDITASLITVTGGILAVFTLLKTHQKSELEREQLDTQKEKDQRDHDRQVHAERRSRYGKAVEHLAGVKPAVRTGGIYALVGLVDEWLADSSVKEDAKDIEAQIIINTLCAYIRSPFDLAEKQNSLEHPLPPEDYDGNFSEDYAKFHEEANLRMSFFNEIDKRINIDINGGKVNFSGPWSKYKFNFDNAPIFYRLHGLKLGTSSFKGARFHGVGDFRYSKFGGDADFTDATFTSELIFNNMVFCGAASFRGTIFKEKLTFHETAFKNDAYFDDAEFIGPANFGGSLFEGLVNFKNANFSEKPYFVRKEGDSTIYTAFSYEIDSSKHKFADRNGRIKTKPTVFMKKHYEIPEGAVIFDPTSLDEKTQTYKSISSPAGATPGTRDRNIFTKR